MGYIYIHQRVRTFAGKRPHQVNIWELGAANLYNYVAHRHTNVVFSLITKPLHEIMITNCTVHRYSGRLVALEYPSEASTPHDKLLLFVGGLGDGINTVPFVEPLAKQLDEEGWNVAEILTNSSYIGFGTSSLSQDSEDISAAIDYFRTSLGKKTVVLMGHSTGSQDVMHYLTQDRDKFRAKVDGGIIQASVSDREGASQYQDKADIEEKVKKAKEWIDNGKGLDVLPYDFDDMSKHAPTNALRFVSLLDVRGGDDFFSSDLNDEDFSRTFGAIEPPTKLLVAYSGNDETVPEYVDKEALIKRWEKNTHPKVWSEYSGIIPGATHNVGDQSSPEALPTLISRVSSFLSETK